jgi:transcriptional regulator with XRE-family HTH domain
MGEHQEFAAWLRERAIAAGYDLSSQRAGGRTKLAADTGISLSQIARTLSGDNRPDIETQRRLSKALHVPLREMLIRSSTILPEDLPAQGQPLPVSNLSAEEVADSWGIRPEDRGLFFAMVDELRKRARD